jgi:hypothetical protein
MIFLVAAEVPKKWHYLPCPPMSYTEVPGTERDRGDWGNGGAMRLTDIFLTYFKAIDFTVIFRTQKRCSRIPKLAILFWMFFELLGLSALSDVMCFFAEQFHIIHTLKQLYFLVLSNVF